MTKRFIYITTLLILVFFVASSCIMVVPRSSNSSSNNNGGSVKQPKAKRIEGKFYVMVTKTSYQLKDQSGTIYVLQSVDKVQRVKLDKMNRNWIAAEIEVSSASKSKPINAKLIRFL